MAATRIEKDSLGEMEVPADAYYGVQTARAVRNFPISGLRPFPEFVDAVVRIKHAAATVHERLGTLTPERAKAIRQAADEVLSGKLRDQFVVDVFQAGAGTSHHMNVNEVLANRGLELMGAARGDYQKLNPNDHVNRGQSTNDVIPTAIRLAGLEAARPLRQALALLYAELRKKGDEFDGILKSGRTHLQDAVTCRLGQEFHGWAVMFGDHAARLERALDELRELGIGGSAAGTGLNTDKGYRPAVCEELSKLTGERLCPARNLMATMQSMAPFVTVASALRNLALDLTKLANDLRLLSSGPNTGLAEFELPAVQPGSSIMPGKVNPVIAEMTNMVCFQVIGNATVVDYASQAGQMELNVMMPVIAYDLVFSLRILGTAVDALAARCIRGIKANPERCLRYAEGSLSIVTVLNPHIGYAKAAEVAKAMLKTGKTAREILLEQKLLDPAKVDEVLKLMPMTVPPDPEAPVGTPPPWA
ncbi:MAG TPA: aspartate ammonia-lyase [Candidatus Saccharimonadales bacterium]|nr:aspartate ammonia-lyase [Candidatus Saccharimonadales bacterium]